MGLGPALREAIEFADGKITNATFGRYKVPGSPTCRPSTST